MDPARQREIASEGGKAAHQKGTAHEFTSEEARRAGSMSHGNRQSAEASSRTSSTSRTSAKPQSESMQGEQGGSRQSEHGGSRQTEHGGSRQTEHGGSRSGHEDSAGGADKHHGPKKS
jgi:hypothetical protein